MNPLFKKILVLLIVIGAINWGLIGLFNYNFVAIIFGGEEAMLTKIIYDLVGLAGLWGITLLF